MRITSNIARSIFYFSVLILFKGLWSNLCNLGWLILNPKLPLKHTKPDPVKPCHPFIVQTLPNQSFINNKIKKEAVRTALIVV